MSTQEQTNTLEAEQRLTRQAKILLTAAVEGEDVFDKAANLVETIESFFEVFYNQEFGEQLKKRIDNHKAMCLRVLEQKREGLLPLVLGRSAALLTDIHALTEILDGTGSIEGAIVSASSKKLKMILRDWHCITHYGFNLPEPEKEEDAE